MIVRGLSVYGAQDFSFVSRTTSSPRMHAFTTTPTDLETVSDSRDSNKTRTFVDFSSQCERFAPQNLHPTWVCVPSLLSFPRERSRAVYSVNVPMSTSTYIGPAVSLSRGGATGTHTHTYTACMHWWQKELMSCTLTPLD